MGYVLPGTTEALGGILLRAEQVRSLSILLSVLGTLVLLPPLQLCIHFLIDLSLD